MNIDKKEQIIRLANEHFDKTTRFQAISMANVPSDFEKRKKLNAEYALAQAELIESKLRLDKVMKIDD